MLYVHTERALLQMDWEMRTTEIVAYKSDYLLDRICLTKNEPRVFVWVIRDCGTHIYNLDQKSLKISDDEEFHDHIRKAIASLKYHQKSENVVGVRAFYEGYMANVTIEDALLLAESYLPAGAATR